MYENSSVLAIKKGGKPTFSAHSNYYDNKTTKYT